MLRSEIRLGQADTRGEDRDVPSPQMPVHGKHNRRAADSGIGTAGIQEAAIAFLRRYEFRRQRPAELVQIDPAVGAAVNAGSRCV